MIRSCAARFAVSAVAVVCIVFATVVVAPAADLKVMSTVALNAVFDDLKPKFEQATGHHLTLVYSVIADLKKRIQLGETADLMFLSRGALDDLEAQGKVATGSIVNVAKSSVAVAAREGVPKPDISTPDALKATLLAAKSVVYADPAKGGASGVHFAKVVERLGITDAMKPKTVLVPGAQAAEVVSKGQAELGVAMASEIVPVAGAQLVGLLPTDLGMTLVFSAGVGATNKDREAGSALIRFITGPDGANVLKAKGLEPM
jgi:molybdate transport system substrate-binding protein